MKNPLISVANRLREGLNIGVSGSQSISPTAYYTGHVWARNGIGPASLSTLEGRLAYWSVQPIVSALGLAGAPTLEQVLLSRHAVIDSLLSDAIVSGRVGNIVEIAAGMSPRGHTFVERFGDQITYVDTDLPQMAALKKAELAKLGQEGDHHRVEVVDALAADGDSSLAAVCAGLDHSKGLAVITEGLLNYLPRESVEGLWQRIASVSTDFPSGLYLSDLHVAGDHTGRLEHLSIAALSTFVRGKVNLHFDGPEDVVAALAKAGFDRRSVHQPADFAGSVPQARSRGAKFVRIVDAQTGV